VRTPLRAQRSEQPSARPQAAPAAREARGRDPAKRRDEIVIEIARVSRKIRTEQAGRS